MKNIRTILSILIFAGILISCRSDRAHTNEDSSILIDSSFVYKGYNPGADDIVISRSDYFNKLYGFWLGECIANWTGLVTEMDKIGNIGTIKTGPFYTRDDWGKPDQPSIWGAGVPSDLSPTINFVLRGEDEVWGADDDTDIEYMYQHLLYNHKSAFLTGEQIRDGWLKHMHLEEENYLWVANQKALDMMQLGHIPPATSDPKYTSDSIYSNYYEMIDAQLTTEIFGFFAPGSPELAVAMARLPIQTTARENAQWISEFYVVMYALAPIVDKALSAKMQIMWMAEKASEQLPKDSYAYKMYEFVKSNYESGVPWESARDAVYERYQVEQKDGYEITALNTYCNGCFVGGINFAASLVSLFYGEGDFKETVKIGVLAGWDSDNPTATWGGLLGFMYGKDGIESAFERQFSDRFNIHRTRRNFPNDGLDNFQNMARTGIFIVDRVIQEQMNGGIDLEKNVWYIPKK